MEGVSQTFWEILLQELSLKLTLLYDKTKRNWMQHFMLSCTCNKPLSFQVFIILYKLEHVFDRAPKISMMSSGQSGDTEQRETQLPQTCLQENKRAAAQNNPQKHQSRIQLSLELLIFDIFGFHAPFLCICILSSLTSPKFSVSLRSLDVSKCRGLPKQR